MNCLSIQTGKHRHVSRNTITRSRLINGNIIIATAKEKEKITHTGTAGKTSLLRKVWGKLTHKLFGRQK